MRSFGETLAPCRNNALHRRTDVWHGEAEMAAPGPGVPVTRVRRLDRRIEELEELDPKPVGGEQVSLVGPVEGGPETLLVSAEVPRGSRIRGA